MIFFKPNKLMLIFSFNRFRTVMFFRLYSITFVSLRSFILLIDEHEHTHFLTKEHEQENIVCFVSRLTLNERIRACLVSVRSFIGLSINI